MPNMSLEYQRAWYAAHPEKRAEYAARHRARHAAEIKDWAHKSYAKNREKRLRQSRAYRAALTPTQQAARLARERERRRKNPQVRKTAAAWRKRNVAKIRLYQIRHKYGLTAEQWNAMLSAQNYICPICAEPLDLTLSTIGAVAIDHCHATNKVRGVLCGLCNRGLGCFRDDQAALARAVSYLRNALA